MQPLNAIQSLPSHLQACIFKDLTVGKSAQKEPGKIGFAACPEGQLIQAILEQAVDVCTL